MAEPNTPKLIRPTEVEFRCRTSGTLAELPGVSVVARLGPDKPEIGRDRARQGFEVKVVDRDVAEYVGPNYLDVADVGFSV